MTTWGVFGPGKGTKATRALYYGKWKPDQLYAYSYSDPPVVIPIRDDQTNSIHKL
jgi:hypothetical protein